LYSAKKQGWKVISCSDGTAPLSIEDIHNQIIKVVKEELSNA
jgi:phosphosulfolactate synthase (CoM biosynthesis protein A)